jgi:very-short-patch-repair endonuclease
MKNLPTRQQVKDRNKTESPIESALLREFHLMDLYPTPQFKVGNYRIDLAFPEKLIAIECDGKEWHSSGEQKIRDGMKDAYLRENGWHVIRITGSDIFKNVDGIVKEMLGLPTPVRKPFTPIRHDDEEYINYDTDLPEFIEEKEQHIRESIDEAGSLEGHSFESMKKIMERCYKHSI